MKHVPVIMASAVFATLASAQTGAPPVSVEDVRVLLIAAIDAPTGQARGVLVGRTADLVAGHFRTSGPILIDVTTERRYRQPGCSRLKLTFSQDGVNLPGAAGPERRTVDIGLNYCRDGTPPKSLS